MSAAQHRAQQISLANTVASPHLITQLSTLPQLQAHLANSQG